MSDLRKVRLRPRRAKPFFHRHPWVFSGAVASVDNAAAKGDLVEVRDAHDRFIAYAFYNPDSQIAARLISWDEHILPDAPFWKERLLEARRLREDILDLPRQTNAYRLVHAEADGMPGLVVDRYAEYAVCQIHSAGFAARREEIVSLVQEVFEPKGLLDVSDPEILASEGIEAPARLLAGAVPPDAIECFDGPARFLVDPVRGQKTGWFLDQRENRKAAAAYMENRRLLDVFSYGGAFGILAATAGKAREVLCIDRSEGALAMARRNADLNRAAQVSFLEGDAAESMRKLKAGGESFGAIVLDPPKFARSRSGVRRALHGYHNINLLGIQLLEPEGILVTCSCSQHVTEGDFLQTVTDAALEGNRRLQILDKRGQAPDHPRIASCPETGYLKCLICRVL